MTSPAPWMSELQDLCEALLEGRLTPEGQQRLEHLVLTEPVARRFYAEYLYQHAVLQWCAGEPSLLAAKRSVTVPPVQTAPRGRRLAVLVALLLVAVGLWYGWLARSQRAPQPLATLIEVKACKWDSGTLPTETGARLTAGRLRLAEGLARIVFDRGANVTLEGPADLELVSAQKCVLHSGRLLAKVPPPALGFSVVTPTALLHDLGTEFGVTVRADQTADVQVFDGVVDVQHRSSARTERLRTGRSVRFSKDTFADFDPQVERPAIAQPAPRASGAGQRVLDISTAMGRGRDAYVQPLFPSPNSSDILLLVKHTQPSKSDYFRKAYIGLDLAAVAGQRIVEAELSFALAPTGMGFAAEVPDATFAVYGLTDEALDDWNEQTLRWHNAPANQDGGTALDPDKVVRLGTFTIAQGVASGTRSIAGTALVDFLNRDTNGLVTFILIRETPGSGRSDLVHGFASKRHPHLPPPTLKLIVAPGE